MKLSTVRRTPNGLFVEMEGVEQGGNFLRLYADPADFYAPDFSTTYQVDVSEWEGDEDGD